MTRNDELFDGKSFNDILRDIYKKSADKDRQIKLLIGELKPFIKNVGDALIVVPMIKDYIDIAVKNDEHIVKVAAIVQRLITGGNNGGEATNEYGLTEEEKKQLLSEIDLMTKETIPIKTLPPNLNTQPE